MKNMLFLIGVLMICISSCDIKHNNAVSGDVLVAVDAIKEVVQNKKEFFNAENGHNIYLSDFRSGNYLYIDDEQYKYTSDAEETAYSFDSFSVLDMDRDGFSEIIMQSLASNILILHYEDGIVYGFVFPFRGMEHIKKDASFVISGGANLNSVGSVSFSKDNAIFNELCLYNELDNIYRVNRKTVSQEMADDCLQMQDKKEEIEWYIYNKSNIEKYLVN